MVNGTQRDTWDKIQSLSTIIATIVIPVVVTVLGNGITKAVRDAEIRAKYTELAIGILQRPPVDGDADVRGWAVEVVQEHSGVPLKQRAIDELLDGAIASSLDASARRSAQADSFLVRAWVPIYARQYAHEIRMLPDLTAAYEAGDTTMIEDTVQMVIEVAIEEVLSRHRELRGNPDTIKREVHAAIQRRVTGMRTSRLRGITS